MKKGIIIYQSKYGATQKYAGWLREMTGFDYIRAKDALPDKVKKYDVIVLCGGIYASSIAGLSFLKKNIVRLGNKKIAVFCVGASPYDEKTFQEFKRHNLKKGLENIPLFYGRGAWDMRKMTLPDRTMCKMLQKSIAKRDPSTYEPWMVGLMSAVGQTGDWTDKKYLAPLMEYLRDL